MAIYAILTSSFSGEFFHLETTSNSPFAVLKYAIVTWWDSAIPLALYSILWMFLSITVIFAAPATFAMFYLVSEILDETMPDNRTILRSMFGFFIKSWGWFLGNLFVTGLIWINWSFYRSMAAVWADALSWFILGVAVLWYGMQLYAVAFYMVQEKKSIFTAWRNALFTALASPGYTLVLWIVIGILAAASALLVVPIILGAPALIAMISSVAVRERVATYKVMMKEKGGSENQEDQEDQGA
jgi:hypothetical protein